MKVWKAFFIGMTLLCSTCSGQTGSPAIATQPAMTASQAGVPTETAIPRTPTLPVQTGQANPPAGYPAPSSGTDNPATQVEPGGREAVFPQTILVYVQEGNYPAGPIQWTFYPTGYVLASSGETWMLEPSQVAPLFSLVESAAFWSLADQYGSPEACQDCLVHTVNVFMDSQVKVIQVYPSGSELPLELQSALDLLAAILDILPTR